MTHDSWVMNHELWVKGAFWRSENLYQEVYKNYFLDFVMFNYTINEFLVTAVDDYGDVAYIKLKLFLLILNFIK